MSRKTAVQIEKQSFDFLKALSKNNNRDWFLANRKRYEFSQQNTIAFAEALLERMREHDLIETASGKQSLYRIYRDVRFSKEKTPYKTNWGGGFRRATKLRRGSYFFQLEPGNTFVAIGFWGPNADDMARIREDIAHNYEDWNKLLRQKTLVKYFGKLRGEQVLTAPRGFSKDHPAIELLRYKQFLLFRKFSDKEALAPGFADELNKTFKAARPFLDHMSEVLTTDLNGVSLFERE